MDRETACSFRISYGEGLNRLRTRRRLSVGLRSWSRVGGMFVPGFERNKRFSDPVRRHADFVDRVSRRADRRAAISVGGDGTLRAEVTDLTIYRFLENAQYVSVRNRQDLALLNELGVSGECFPDIVWQSGRCFPRVRHSGPRLRIGLDLSVSHFLDQRAIHALILLQAAVLARHDVTFVCLNSTHRVMGQSAGIGRLIRGFNVELYQFHDFESDSDILASLDLLISNRLHVPLVALQYGVPVVSLLGEGRTRLFFENLGLGSQSYDRGRILELAGIVSSRQKIARLIEGYPVSYDRKSCSLSA